ncbi:Rhomboid- protein 2 [Bulinus truncatus]|nr:Rhomboid- protein 2 [Bulinus truncatus]
MRTALAALMPTRDREDFLANYNCCPPPIFIPLISVIEIVVFIVYVFELKERGIKTTFTSGFDSESPLVYKSCKRYSHIIFNLGFQLLFGSLLEVVHKHWRVAIVYLLGVIAGCLAHSVIEPKISLVGASGGVYAILGAFVASVVIVDGESGKKSIGGMEEERGVMWMMRWEGGCPMKASLVGRWV